VVTTSVLNVDALQDHIIPPPCSKAPVFAAAREMGVTGLNRLAHDGLVKRGIGGHWSLVPKLAKTAVETASKPTICRSVFLPAVP